MHGQPDRVASGFGPLDPVLEAGLDVQIIARFQDENPILPLYPQTGASRDQQDKFVLLLIVPEPFRRGLPPGDDPFDPDLSSRAQSLHKFFRKLPGDLFKQ